MNSYSNQPSTNTNYRSMNNQTFNQNQKESSFSYEPINSYSNQQRSNTSYRSTNNQTIQIEKQNKQEGYFHFDFLYLIGNDCMHNIGA